MNTQATFFTSFSFLFFYLPLYLLHLVHGHADYAPLVSIPSLRSTGISAKQRQRQQQIHSLFDEKVLNIQPEMIEASSNLHVDLIVGTSRFTNSFVSMNTRTYNGMMSAPTLRLLPGETFTIRISNTLEPGFSNWTNLHTHGLQVAQTGMADNVLVEVQPGEIRTYQITLPEDHPSGTFWYHPHHHGAVNLQVTGMMAGALIVEDRDAPTALANMDELVLLLQAVCFEGCGNKWDNLEHALMNTYGKPEEGDRQLDVDLVYDTENLPLHDASKLHVMINGQYQPIVTLQPEELKRYRYINALANNFVELVVPGCEMYVLAKDGMYRKAPTLVTVLILPPGGRADVALRCHQVGTYQLGIDRSHFRDATIGPQREHRADSQTIATINVTGDFRSMELPTELPSTTLDLTNVANVPSPQQYEYEMSTWMERGVMKFGVNHRVFDRKFISNYTIPIHEIQEWHLTASNCMGSCSAMNHPFHIHNTHFQIVDVAGEMKDNDDLYEVGEWRDTIPLLHDGLTIRFLPTMEGPMLTHCHVVAHADEGMSMLFHVVKE